LPGRGAARALSGHGSGPVAEEAEVVVVEAEEAEVVAEEAGAEAVEAERRWSP